MIHTQTRKSMVYLLLIFGILFTGVLLSGCIQQEDLYEEKYSREISALETFSGLLSTRQDMFVQDAFAAQKALVNDPDNETIIRESLTSIHASNPTISHVVYVNKTGYITYAVPFGSENVIGKHVEGIDTTPNAQFVSAEIIYGTNGETLMPAEVLPIIKDGVYQGSVLAFLDMTGPVSLIRTLFSESDSWTFWIINTDGEVIVAPQARFIGMNAHDIPSPDKAGVVEAFDRIFTTESGVEVITAYSFTQRKLSDYAIVWNTVLVNPATDESLTVALVSELTERDPYAKPPVSTEKDLEEFVQSAYLFTKQHGKEAALAEFNKPEGQFTTDTYYIIASNSSTVLANPYMPWNVNSTSFYIDSNGVRVSELLNRRAVQGGGYGIVTYPNPAADMQEQLVTAYILPIDDEWYIISGSYEDKAVRVDPEERDMLIQYLRSVATFAESVSMEDAAKVLNDPNGPYYPEKSIRFFAMDNKGNVLVDPVALENVGLNYMERTDMFGSSITRDAVLLAGSGGGYQYEYVPVRGDTGALELRYEYILPVNDEWFVLASIKAE